MLAAQAAAATYHRTHRQPTHHPNQHAHPGALARRLPEVMDLWQQQRVQGHLGSEHEKQHAILQKTPREVSRQQAQRQQVEQHKQQNTGTPGSSPSGVTAPRWLTVRQDHQ